MKQKKWRLTALLACALFFGLFLASCSERSDDTDAIKTYTLTTNAIPANGGSVSRSSVLTKYDAGTQITVTAAPNDGYMFTAWTGAPSGVNVSSAEITFGINSNLTLTANFEAIPQGTYAVTVISAGTGATNNGNYAAGTTVTINAGTPPDGQEFLNWTTASNGVNFADANNAITSFTMPANAVTVTANFETLSSIPNNVIRAEPVAASNNPSEPKIAGSWTDGEKNYYVIDAGVIRNIFLSAIFGPEHYDGFHTVPVTIKNITTSTVTASTTETVSKSIAVSNTLGVKLGLEEAIKAGIPGIGDISVKLNLEVSETVNVSNGKTTSTSVNHIESYVQTEEISRTMTFGSNGAPAGYYRYALYGVSDVYFVIATSLNNQDLLNWDVISCVRPNDYLRHNDYSPNGNFDNSPSIESQIVFAEGFYKNLPKPTNIVKKPELKVITEEFTAVGTHNYIFDKGFPATIEVYALGAGGGGQGGHRANALIGWEGSGTGGAGGGGAAAYMKFEIMNPLSFNINVGKGGAGGGGLFRGVGDNWRTGYKGVDGTPTIVNWNTSTLSVAGGKGGGEGRASDIGTDATGRILIGGSGGTESTKPSAISQNNWSSSLGYKGGDGQQSGNITTSQQVGIGASIGGYSAGNGGRGGYGSSVSNDGSNNGVNSTSGGDGKVIIVIKYYE